MRITNCELDARMSVPILNPSTRVFRTEATHRFIAKAVRDVEINDLEAASSGNRFLGGPYFCWDENKDNLCDRR